MHRVHKWRIQSVKSKYMFLIPQPVQVFTLKCCFCYLFFIWTLGASFKSPCFWSRQYIYTCYHRTWCTPSGGDRGRCDVAFSLDRAPGSGEKRRKGGNLTVLILHQLTSGAAGLKKLPFKSLNAKMDVVLAELIVAISRWSKWCMALIGPVHCGQDQ